MLRIILTWRQNLTVGRIPTYGEQPNYHYQRASITMVGWEVFALDEADVQKSY